MTCKHSRQAIITGRSFEVIDGRIPSLILLVFFFQHVHFMPQVLHLFMKILVLLFQFLILSADLFDINTSWCTEVLLDVVHSITWPLRLLVESNKNPCQL